MIMLKRGSTGNDVIKWQNFLRGVEVYSEVVANGVFDETTESETKAFQSSRNLKADGVVGQITIAEAIKVGYDIGTNPSWPSNPGIKNLSFIERQKLFGSFLFIPAPIPGNPEAIRITSGWAVDNITTIVIPQLAGVNGASKTGSIQVHKKIANQTSSLFYAWENAGLKDKILSWGGSWVPRFIRGSRTSLSNHSWGTAFDINAEWNGLGVRPANINSKGSVRDLVEIATQHGFYWGGWFHNRSDGMHFEAYKIV